jgi:hypothetical protein
MEMILMVRNLAPILSTRYVRMTQRRRRNLVYTLRSVDYLDYPEGSKRTVLSSPPKSHRHEYHNVAEAADTGSIVREHAALLEREFGPPVTPKPNDSQHQRQTRPQPQPAN